MWQDMEDARKASLQAQALSTFCRQMCAKSEEDTVRIQKDIKRRLEIKVKDEAFWIGEAETSHSEVKGIIEELRGLEQRVKRGRDNCAHNFRLDSESMGQMREKSEMPEVECAMRALSTEVELLSGAVGVVDEIGENIKHSIGMMQNVGVALEQELNNKHENLRVNKLSIVGLKRHSAAPEVLPEIEENLVATDEFRRSTSKNPMRSRTATDGAENGGKSNATIRSAAAHITAAKTLVDKVTNVLHKLTLDLLSESDKVTRTLSDVITNAQQEKADLEHHLAMVDEQMTEIGNSEALLQKALTEKRKSAGVVRGQMLMRKIEGQRDDISRMLEQELAEAERDLRALSERAPQLQGAARSLRRSRLAVEDAIRRKTSAIGMVQTRCINPRDAMRCPKL